MHLMINFTFEHKNNKQMNHRNEDEIKCPYCGYEDKDSWEMHDDSGTWYCKECTEAFDVERIVSVTYSTYKKRCADGDHDYQVSHSFIGTHKFTGGVWQMLPESQWKYYNCMKCTVCEHETHVEISKQEYESQSE